MDTTDEIEEGDRVIMEHDDHPDMPYSVEEYDGTEYNTIGQFATRQEAEDLKQRTWKDPVRDEYDVVMGMYFKDGDHVPLNDRPDELVDQIEAELRGIDGLHETAKVGFQYTIHVDGLTAEEVRDLLDDAVEDSRLYWVHRGTNEHTGIPEETDTAHSFSLKVV